MSVAARFLTSLRRHGLLYAIVAAGRHLSTYASIVLDRGFDRRHGTETGGVVEVADMADVTSENLDRGIRYEPTRARPFLRVMRDVPFSQGSVFVDIGCGRGRLLVLAAELGFARVEGVDYSPSLCDDARRNLDSFRRRTGSQIEARVSCCDAVAFEFSPDHNVIFLFNPFDATVLERVLDNLDTSLAAAPRSLWLIYHFPAWRDTIESRGFSTVIERAYGGCEFVVYHKDA